MQQGLINAYKEGGFLPEWSSPGFRNVMVGNNSASVVSDAYIKGLRGYDINVLYEALLKGANNEGPLTAVGRAGVKYYNELGYVPYDVKVNENAARTLEYAYDDFAIYQLAKALKKPAADIELYAKRSQNYRNLLIHHSSDPILSFPRLPGIVIQINHVLDRLIAVCILTHIHDLHFPYLMNHGTIIAFVK